MHWWKLLRFIMFSFIGWLSFKVSRRLCNSDTPDLKYWGRWHKRPLPWCFLCENVSVEGASVREYSLTSFLIHDTIYNHEKNIDRYAIHWSGLSPLSGATLSEIAADFGISLSSLSQIKKRRETDWERIRYQIISLDIAKLNGSEIQHPPKHIREILSHILLIFIKTPTRQQILDQLCADKACSPVEAENYIQTFETLFPLEIPR